MGHTHQPKLQPYQFHALRGRYGYWPAQTATSKRTFVIVYGQHASLERLSPLVAAFRQFGEVYAVDNPGFGGMDASFQMGRYPDLHFFAEHLATFIQDIVPKQRQITLVGISYGFQIAVQTIHEYPSVRDRTETIISLMGFVRPSNLAMPMSYKIPLIYGLAFPGRTWLGSKLFSLIARPKVIEAVYLLTKPIQVKLKNVSRSQARQYAQEQARLWIDNDPRTHGATAWDFVTRNDLTPYRLAVPAICLGVPQDHILDTEQVKTDMSRMFSRLDSYDLELDNHAPLDIDEAGVSRLIPKRLAEILKTTDNGAKELP